MNKLEANLMLFTITFYAAIQYAFLAGVPQNISTFSFLFITNLIGFLIMLLFFFGELFRLDKWQVLQSLVLALELVGVNVFMMLGTADVGAMVSASVLSAYFAFVPLLDFLCFKKKPDKRILPGILIVLTGLFFMMNLDMGGLLHRGIFFLLATDIFFALYVLTLSRYSVDSNPAVLSMGQMLFSAVFAFILWMAECLIKSTPPSLPREPAFWGGVIYISFFIRGLYGIIQIYALRYVSAFNSSLIFSTEIIMTMLMSPVLALVFGTAPEPITPLRVTGAVIMVAGILLSDGAVYEKLKRRVFREKKSA
ncbi:MAG: DMT family transporter [Lachnospiraceae bacterium]|nr:DMT family transporter [Lachnospiraceae bacterium]